MVRSAADERGAVLVLVAALVGFVFVPFLVAYVIDLSSFWTHNRHLQLQADATALAGGAKFNDLFNGATTDGCNLDIQTTASDYSGTNAGNATNPNQAPPFASSTDSTRNTQGGQFGGNPGEVHMLYNSTYYAYPGGGQVSESEPAGQET